MSVVLRCRVCGKDGQRSEVDNQWCHLEDELVLGGTVRGIHLEGPGADHEFVPDVIDVGAPPVTQPPAPATPALPDTKSHSHWPFGRLQ